MVRALVSIYCYDLPCPLLPSPVAELLRHVCLHIPAQKNLISQWITANNKTGVPYVLIHNTRDCSIQCPSNIWKARHFRRWPHLFSGDCHYTERYFLLSLLMKLVTLVMVNATSLVYKVAHKCSELQINPPQYWFLGFVYYIHGATHKFGEFDHKKVLTVTSSYRRFFQCSHLGHIYSHPSVFPAISCIPGSSQIWVCW